MSRVGVGGVKGLKARILHDMQFVAGDASERRTVTLHAGTILDVVPATVADINAQAFDGHELSALLRWHAKRRADEPSTILVVWEDKIRYAKLGTDCEYFDPTVTPAPAAPTALKRDIPAWAVIKDTP